VALGERRDRDGPRVRAAPSPRSANDLTQETVSRQADPAETRYRSAVDVQRAADLYAQGRSVRQIGAELGVHWSTVSHQLQKAGITMRRGAPRAHPASTQQILELRDQGLTWNEVARRVA
jgi:DNA-binding transcriptional ArsR family regulator